jgi:hypothetical protein
MRAILTAIRRASSFVSSLVSARSGGHRLGRASLMTGGAPLPVQLPPLSSSRAKQHRRPQDWSALFRFSREDAAADYPCSQGCKKDRKLCLLHRGDSIARHHSAAIIMRTARQVLRRDSSEISRSAPPCFQVSITRSQKWGRRWLTGLAFLLARFLAIPILPNLAS